MSFTNKADIGVALTIWNSIDMKVLLKTIERQKINKQYAFSHVCLMLKYGPVMSKFLIV